MCIVVVHANYLHNKNESNDKERKKESERKNIVNSKNKISSTILQRRSELFKNHVRVILQMNRLSKFNDRDKNFKVIRFLIQFGLNIHNLI